jgi:uncharacterized protein DUF3313
MKAFGVVVLLILASGCARRHPLATPPRAPVVTQPPDSSGFLDDYSLLQKGDATDLHLVYRNADADWRAYDKVLLEPVTLWRSGRKSLDPVPKEDLLRLVSDFQRAIRTRLGEDFAMVDKPGPGVMRIRVGITEAQASDPLLDVLTATRGTGRRHPAGNGALHAETRRFLAAAAIEGEIRDAQTNVLLAEGIDRRKPDAPPLTTWAQVDRGFTFWAERTCARLEARTGRSPGR